MPVSWTPKNEDERKFLLGMPGVKPGAEGTLLVSYSALATVLNALEPECAVGSTRQTLSALRPAPAIRPGAAAEAGAAEKPQR